MSDKDTTTTEKASVSQRMGDWELSFLPSEQVTTEPTIVRYRNGNPVTLTITGSHGNGNTAVRQTVGMTSKIRVAAYIRISTDSSDQENSYEMQERYFTQLLASQKSWVCAGIYMDYGISGTTKKRTGFARLMRHCQEGKIDRIVCKSISRFARNTADFMTAIENLHHMRISILFERENIDTANAVNHFILTTLSAVAQEESHSISENKLWSFSKSFQNGDVPNIDIYGYRFIEGEGGIHITSSGYKMRQVEVITEEAQIVNRIFREVAEKKSYMDVARGLNRDGIPAPSGNTKKKGKRYCANGGPASGSLKADMEMGWTGRQIGEMIKSERYTGDVYAQKSYTEDYLTHRVRNNKGERPSYYIKDHHPAIIARELFEKVQQIRKENAKRYGRYDTVKKRKKRCFSGILICVYCGRFYQLQNHHSWFCPSAYIKNGLTICHAEGLEEEQVKQAVKKGFHARFGSSSKRVAEVLGKLRMTEDMEKDRFLRKCQIFELQLRVKNLEKRQQAYGEEITRQKQHTLERLVGLENELNQLEQYWEEVERRYDRRQEAIRWIEKGVTKNKLLDGIAGDYTQAFVLSIAVTDAKHYAIRWFDNVETFVEI